MPYIGNDIQYGELNSQTFTGDGSTTAFTLNYTVSNVNSLLVTVADVIQEPTTAYTVSGTTLTFTSAPANSDTIHVRYLGRTLDVGTTAIVQDSDQDTKIQVEESADEDTIRFDTGGTEVATIAAALTEIKNGALTLSGTTPTLTIGDAGAEDAKIVFDGNAQDFHIGLDDSADDLVIGLGSALGTTTHMSFDENGVIGLPLQPAFSAFRTTVGNTIASGATSKVQFNGEHFDIGGHYDNATNYRFTAPVAGKYLFNTHIGLYGFGSTNGGRINCYFYKNGSLWADLQRVVVGASTAFNSVHAEATIGGSIILDLAVSDYIEIFVYNNTGATITVNYGAAQTYSGFSGYKLA